MKIVTVTIAMAFEDSVAPDTTRIEDDLDALLGDGLEAERYRVTVTTDRQHDIPDINWGGEDVEDDLDRWNAEVDAQPEFQP